MCQGILEYDLEHDVKSLFACWCSLYIKWYNMYAFEQVEANKLTDKFAFYKHGTVKPVQVSHQGTEKWSKTKWNTMEYHTIHHNHSQSNIPLVLKLKLSQSSCSGLPHGVAALNEKLRDLQNGFAKAGQPTVLKQTQQCIL